MIYAAYLKYYTGIHIKGLKKPNTNIIQQS